MKNDLNNKLKNVIFYKDQENKEYRDIENYLNRMQRVKFTNGYNYLTL
jgi:hypothetical protein